MRRALSSRLEQEGYAVQAAASAETGLEILKQNHIDLILLDLRLNGHSGLDVLKAVQDISGDSRPRVLVLTNIEHPGMTMETVALGLPAEDYLFKTKVSLEDIVSRVKAKLES